MAFGDITQSKTTGNIGGDVSSIAATFDSAITEGNLLLALHFTGDDDSQAPSGFSEAVALTDSGQDDQGAIYYKIAGVAESTTITCASGNADSDHVLTIAEIEGPWNATPLDQTASAGPATTTTQSSGTTGTTSQADEFAAVLITSRRNVEPGFSGWTNSFTELSDLRTTEKSQGTAYRVLTSTGTYETTATINSGRAMGGIATFKKQAAGAADSITPLQRQIRARRLPHWRM